jgi:multidrug resistance efflux pump
MKRITRATILVIGFVVLCGLAMVFLWPKAPLDATPAFTAAPAVRLVCFGHVDSRQGPLLLQPARAGRVASVFVKERQTISKDAPLLQIDDRLVKLQEQQALLAIDAARLQLTRAKNGLKQYQAKQAQAEAAVQAARQKLVAAQHYLAVQEQLLKQGLGNKDEMEAVRAQCKGARALMEVEQNKIVELKAVDPTLDVKLARLQLEQSQAQWERARQDREEYLLRAPANGVILRLQAQVGDLVGPTSPRPAVWLSPEGAFIVRAEVAQEFAGRVHEGLTVQVEDEASAELLAKGTIAEVSDWFLPRRQLSPQPTAINTGLTLECVIELRERFAQLRLGQRVRVRILKPEG